MKYTIVADIHANLEALEAVLADMKQQRCTHVACAGDIVGYNANPKECLDIIRAMNMPCVKGNHDQACGSDELLNNLNPRAARVVEWTRRQLTESDRRWLVDLSYVETVAGFTIVHGTLDQPERWGYVFDSLGAAASFHHQKTVVCFHGHTHVAVAFVRNREVRGSTSSQVTVEPDKQYFVNVGSVGQPRDHDPRAAYVTYEIESGIIKLRRVEYDVPGAQEKVRALGFPTFPFRE